MTLRFLNRKEIDTAKWDTCIRNAVNSLIYGYSWYLDIFADNWSGIVNADYTCVMPIVWRRKYGIRYTYRPFLIQQQGVFVQQNTCDIRLFYKFLHRKFYFGDYNFNYANRLKISKMYINRNYILPLSDNYDGIYARYSKNHKRNLKKVVKNNLRVVENENIDVLIEFKKLNPVNKLIDAQFDRVKFLCNSLPESRKNILSIYDNENLLSSALFVLQDNRFYFLLGATSQAGNEKKASFLLFDYFIKKYSGSEYVLDFEGSNIPGVARFFAGWGSEYVEYQTVNLAFF